MKQIELRDGNYNKGPAGYICNTSEFVRETDAADGSELQVVNESTNTVDQYCVAYNGKWFDR